MKVAFQALMLFATFGLVACGNHNKAAPVVYGADAPQYARIYTSRKEIYRKQEEEQARQAAATYAPAPLAASQNSKVKLTPVSAVYLSEPKPAKPVVTSHKVKGYIEVQPGDTVYAIGRRFGVPPKAIISANKLRTPYALTVGQALKLPKGARVAAVSTPSRQVVARDMLYSVRKGDTLYSISKASKTTAQAIAQANALRPPYSLAVGQQILIPQARANTDIYARTVKRQRKNQSSKIANATAAPRDVGDIARNVSYTQPPSAKSGSLFEWPVRGAVIASYRSGAVGRRNDGINIAAPAGTPVRAAADGEVVYRGSGLDGFGNLLLVRHTDGFVTAYAHNDAMLVKKGDTVRQGQMIAKVGDSGAVKSPQLHFEVRQNLKSVDPMTLLGNQ
jgi:murein DD-endopeptidase MepM/ murein hydrolase activator NlpD